MPSSMPPGWWKASGCWLVLAFLLAGSNVRSGEQVPPAQPIQELGSHAAAELLIHVAKPAYPAIAKMNFIQGSVELAITVNSMGRVVSTHVIDGEPLLAVAAIEAVRKWLYSPYVSTNGPAPFSTDVVVKFALREPGKRAQLPQNPDKDLEKQILPPEVIAPARMDPSAAAVPMKVLVGAKGEVVDAISEVSEGSQIDQARKNLATWKFRPARWGAIPVPWYINVKVPVGRVPMGQAAAPAAR